MTLYSGDGAKVIEGRKLDLGIEVFEVASGPATVFLVRQTPAKAVYFQPRIRANRAGNKIRVRIWISANIGPVNMSNHYLGSFYVPDGNTLRRTIKFELATIKIVLKAKNQVVEAVIKMLSAMFATQTKVMSASISGG